MTDRKTVARVVKNTDVLDEPADALVYSTNVMLNCTGGVGACLVSRYGVHVQEELHALLKERGVRYGSQGEVFEHVCTGMPYKKMFHTMPCDGWYNTSPEVVADILHRCLAECAQEDGIESVAISALATGYGHLDFEDFFRVANQVLNDPAYASIPRVVICIANPPSFQQALELIEREQMKLKAEPAGTELEVSE